MTRRVCIRCGTLQPANGGQPCTACGASSFSLVPEKVSSKPMWAKGGLTVARESDECDYSPETP